MLLTREEGGGGITITTSQQPQPTPTQIIHPPTTTQMQTQNQQIQPQQPARTIVMDHDEKKMRRQIANSNERRRMQSINAGFQSLRQLLPHHEGEKLSKAAILQQTAEYIERLEQEKQRLFQQNQHLKRLLEQQEGGANNNNNNVEYPSQVVQQQISTSPSSNTTTTVVPSVKKRKLEAVMTIQTDSSDEGLGSMSPEPISQMTGSATTKTHTTHVINAPISSVVTAKDYQDLQKQMETERQHRLKLEEELKNLQSQFYSSERIQFPTKYVYHRQDDHMNGHLREEIIDEMNGRDRDEEKVIMHGNGQAIIQDGSVQYAIESVPAHHQYVVCTTMSPASTPRHIQEVMIEDDDSSRTLSSDELNKEEPKIILTSKAIKRSPNHYNTSRMPSILEQAIKAEPKVEVERINSPSTIPIPCSEDAIHSPPPSRSPVSITISRNVAPPPVVRTYPTNSARPNLETIVEAIRHLEGDALFDMVDQDQCKASSPSPQPQDVPLALTTHKYSKETRQQDIHPFLKFHTAEPSQGASLPTIQVTTTAGNNKMHTIYQHHQNQQQCFRPGVIVVKK